MIVELNTAIKASTLDIFGYRNVKVLETNAVTDKSNAFGTPIFMQFSFDRIKYKDPTSNRELITPELKIPCAIIEISFQKEVVKTMVQGQKRPGSFKEHINLGDYVVSIKGVLCDDTNKYPMKQVKWLNDFIKAPIAIPITHTLMNEIGIYNLVIESGGLIPRPGYENLQAFQLNCVSDLPIELTLKNEDEAKKA